MRARSYDAIVVGASFAGLACARGLADRGFDVLVLERKREPGQGIRTTGIVVKEAAAALDPPAALTRAIRRVRLYAPSLGMIELAAPDYFFLATDTPGLMRHLVARTAGAGACLRFATPFRAAVPLDDGGFALPDLGVRARFLIGADGPRSTVARALGLGRNRRFLLGVEAEFATADLPARDAFHCFLTQGLAPGYLGWAVPGVGTVQVGLAARMPARPDLDAFIAHIGPAIGLDKAAIVARRGGRIPVGGPVRPVWRGNAILLGDAAGTVSPLSAGGIHMADHYGDRLARHIAAHLGGRAEHPGRLIARDYPNLRFKRLQRWAFERCAPDWLLDALIPSAPMRAVARAIFFRRKRLPD